jgi:hypothetical protein
MTWPLATQLVSHIPDDGGGDPLLQAWQVAWGGHALTHEPLRYFQANAFWPLRNSLAFSDALIGYAPAGAIGSGVQAALVRYNLLYLFSYALAFVGAFLLARELGVGSLAASVAGASFAYNPWRMSQWGHLHVLSSGGIPLSVFFLLRGYRGQQPRIVLLGWLTATWQLSLGFSLGLQLAYVLAVLGALAIAVSIRGGRPTLNRPLALASVVGIGAFVVWAALQARPYRKW